MLGSLEFFLVWILPTILPAAVVVCALRAKCFLRYFPLNFYMLAASTVTVGRYLVLHEYGVKSGQYLKFYFYSDALLTICLFFAITGLFSYVFREMRAEPYIRIGAVGVLLLTVLVTYIMVRRNFQGVSFAANTTQARRMVFDFNDKFSQNLYFVGAVLTYLLWGAVKKLKETRTQLIQFVLSLGVYFTALAASYAFGVLNPTNPIWIFFGPYAAGLWLPIAWAYTFLKIPKTAKLEPARVALGGHQATAQ
jgi:hypothetical protein